MTTFDHQEPAARDPGAPVKLPPRQRVPFLTRALPLLSVSSAILLFLAALSLLDATTLVDYAKAFILAVSAGVVSYGVNKLAVDQGAELGTTGYRGASLVAVTSIPLVGAGLFAATYAGLTLKDTGKIMLQAHGEALSAYVGQRSAAASAAARINPAMRATESDLRDKAECEAKTSCISGRANGGNGTVARIVAGHAGRAASIAQQIEAGETAREQIVRQLNTDIAAYHGILADETLSGTEQRVKLQAADARIRQGVGALDAVVPVALVGAYAKELQSGVSIPDRRDAEARLNAILSRHGKSLQTVIEDSADMKALAPSFPGRPGVSDTLRYIPHFLPIAAIATVVELVFPLVLWAYTFWSLAWRKHSDDRPPANDDRGQDQPKPSASERPDEPETPRGRGRPPRLPNGDARRGGH